MAQDAPNQSGNAFTRLGGFEILEQIGEGGMGVVYRAKQSSLDRLVALKVLNARLASDEKYLDSFRREARSAARLSHSNIIPVYDAGEADGSFYYAMEFVSGETLSKWVRRDGALPETTALEITLCVASALKYAWEREHLIHRDIKPENIIIDTKGNVKICDLGLAKNFGENTLLSLSGQAFGTPNYMSPEQARADRSVDCRSDIYSLGLTLYFALTNEIPYHGGTATLVMARHMTEQLPDPRTHAPNLSPFTCQLMEKMAARDVEDRYQTWDELIADIQLVRAGQPPAAAPLSLKKSSIARAASDAERLADLQARAAVTSASGKSQVSALSPQPSVKSRTPIYIMVGALALLALGGVGGWLLFKGGRETLSTSSQQPPVVATQNQEPAVPLFHPPTEPVRPIEPVAPVIAPVRSDEAKRLMEQAHKLATSSPSEVELGQVVQLLQTVANNYAGTPEAEEAQQVLPVFRERHEKAAREAALRREEEHRIAEQRAREEEEHARTLTVFSEVQKTFLDALAKRDYAEAEKIAQTAASNPLLASLKDRATSFADIAKRLNNFWSSLSATLAPLKGREFTLQNETGNYDGISQGNLGLEKKIGNSGAVVVDVPLAKITPDELVGLVNATRPSSDTLLSLAWFFFAEGKPNGADKQFVIAEKAGADADASRSLLVFMSKNQFEAEAKRILANLRGQIDRKEWQQAHALVQVFKSKYSQARVFQQAVLESSDMKVMEDKITAGLRGANHTNPPPPNRTTAPLKVDTSRMPDGNFAQPKREKTPQTFLKVVSTKGDYIGQGKDYTYGADEIKAAGNEKGLNISAGGWNLRFSPSRGGTLKVSEYLNAKRHPFNDDSPGISFGGHGRGSNKIEGRFVIWEMEFDGGQMKKLAVDFVQHSESAARPPLFGTLRYNSSFGDEPE